MPKMVNLTNFYKPQNLEVSFYWPKNGDKCQNWEKLKCDILSSFQTMWTYWIMGNPSLLSLIVGPDWTRRSRMTSPEDKVNKTNKMVSFMVLTQMRTDG